MLARENIIRRKKEKEKLKNLKRCIAGNFNNG